MPPTPSDAPDQRARNAIRRHARHWRSRLDPARREQADHAIAQRLLAWLHQTAPPPRTVALFAPFGDETTAPRRLYDAAAEAYAFALPRTDRATRTMAFHSLDAWPATTGAYGIAEPPPDAPMLPLAQLDVVLVPGLAFDARGHRLGYGAGFYDRALSARGVQAVLVGVCYGGQCVDDIPIAAHDVPVDIVVTESFLIEARARREAPAN
jgi:5-formyltetrahydrofolate cyclo-ligase